MCLVWANWKYRKGRLTLDVTLEVVLTEQNGRPGLEVGPPGMRDQQPRDEGPRPGSGRGSPAPVLDEVQVRVSALPPTVLSEAPPPPAPRPSCEVAQTARGLDTLPPPSRPPPSHRTGDVHSQLAHSQNRRKAAPASWEGLCFFWSWFFSFLFIRRSLRHRQLLGCLHHQKRAPCSAGPGLQGSPGWTVHLFPSSGRKMLTCLVLGGPSDRSRAETHSTLPRGSRRWLSDQRVFWTRRNHPQPAEWPEDPKGRS